MFFKLYLFDFACMDNRTFTETIVHKENNFHITSIPDSISRNLEMEVLKWVQHLKSSPSFIADVLACNFIFDYIKSEMLYCSPSITRLLGFNQQDFTGKTGMGKLIDLINPNDFKVYDEQIFPKDMEYLNSLPYAETEGITFSNNFRIQYSTGLYKTILMKKCFITHPETRQLLYEIGVLIDISSIKKELSITHNIERIYKNADIQSFIKVITEDYFPEMHASILSAREKEILTHLAKGTKRKEVGVKLFISDNTVANHIKTILRKTHSQNIREAIDICKMNGII